MTVRERLATSGIAYKDPLLDAIDAEIAETNARVEALEARARGVRNIGPGWVSKVRAAEIVGRSKASILRYVESGLIPEKDPETGETVWQIVRGRRLYSEAWLRRNQGLRRGG